MTLEATQPSKNAFRPSKAAQIALEAAKIVDGDRRQTHGPAERSFDLVAALWSAYTGNLLTPVDVAQMMVLLKIARAKCGKPVEDHFVDQCGYSTLAGEMAMGEDA